MKDARLKDKAWRERTGFDNIMSVDELLAEMPAEQRYRTMDRLDALGYYDRGTK